LGRWGSQQPGLPLGLEQLSSPQLAGALILRRICTVWLSGGLGHPASIRELTGVP
jgi:hypothetical protein